MRDQVPLSRDLMQPWKPGPKVLPSWSISPLVCSSSFCHWEAASSSSTRGHQTRPELKSRRPSGLPSQCLLQVSVCSSLMLLVAGCPTQGDMEMKRDDVCKAPRSEVSGSAGAASCPAFLYLGLDEWLVGPRWVVCTVWPPSPALEVPLRRALPMLPLPLPLPTQPPRCLSSAHAEDGASDL